MPSSLKLILLYTAVILGILLWSGLKTEKTIYDRFAASFERIELLVTDYNTAVKFYSEVLNLTPAKTPHGASTNDGDAYFHLPSSKTLLHLVEQEGPGQERSSTTRIVLRVKNGFAKLHQGIAQRSKLPLQSNAIPRAEELFASQVSAIFDSPDGETFYVKDPAGNIFVFQSISKLRALATKSKLLSKGATNK